MTPRLARVIPPQSGDAFRLAAGERLRITDPRGGQVCDLFCFTDDSERVPLSSGRSIDYNETLLFTRGHVLYSNRGEPLLEITEDTCGRHDFLVTPCSQQMFHMVSGSDAYHPSCLENLERAFRAARFGVDPGRIATTFNAFMNVVFEPSGRVRVLAPLSRAGDFLELLARRDLLVGLTACSDEGSNGGSCKEIEFAVFGTA